MASSELLGSLTERDDAMEVGDDVERAVGLVNGWRRRGGGGMATGGGTGAGCMHWCHRGTVVVVIAVAALGGRCRTIVVILVVVALGG